jgi:dUTP pyrophosphatase
MKRTGKRYYKIGEKVWVKPLKKLGVVTQLMIEPENNVYKAQVSVKQADNTNVSLIFDLWEIDKNKRTLYKRLRRKMRRIRKLPTILFAKVRENAIIPSKRVEDAGYDIYANFEGNELVINPQEIVLVPTGIASSVKDDYVLVAKERSSTGTKGMAVRCGVIDSGYRNEIFIPINNTTNKKIVITKTPDAQYGDDVIVYPATKAIAQLLLLPVPKANVKEIPYEQLKEIPSQRGMGALGSTQK